MKTTDIQKTPHRNSATAAAPAPWSEATTGMNVSSLPAKSRMQKQISTTLGRGYYDEGVSVWLSVDPMANKHLDLTPYHYCSNNPIMKIDPNGEDDIFNKKGEYVRSTRKGNKIKIRTGLFGLLKKTITELDYSESNSKNREALSNIATYYGHKAGFSSDKTVSASEVDVVGAFAYYDINTGQIHICIIDEGKINSLADDINNMINSFAHEKAHEDIPSTRVIFGESEAILIESNHYSFEGTTRDYKFAAGAYAVTTINEALRNKEISIPEVKQRIDELNKLPLGKHVYFQIDSETNIVHGSNLLPKFRKNE